MKTVYNAFYLSVFLYFLRRILFKVTQDLTEGIPRRSHDTSGCWNVVVRGVPLMYTFEKALAFEVARQVREEVPGLQGAHDIEVIEDEDLLSQAPEQVPGLNSQDCCELGLILNANELD